MPAKIRSTAAILALALALALLLSLVSPLIGQEAPPLSQEVGTLLAQAQLAIEEQQLEQALALYLQARRLRYPLPEAEFGIAKVYHAEGLVEAAERQYQRALDQSDYFQSSEFAIAARYELAQLYQQVERWADFERTLLEITASERRFSDPQRRLEREAMRRLLTSEGIDRVIELYRLMNLHTLNAHVQLGIFMVGSGNYSPAVLHLLFATIKKIEYILNAVRIYDAVYSFSSLEQLLNDIQNYPEALIALQSGEDLYQLLYFLGAALLGDAPASPTRQTLWKLVARWSADPQRRDRAQAQLRRPRLEPLIYSIR